MVGHSMLLVHVRTSFSHAERRAHSCAGLRRTDEEPLDVEVYSISYNHGSRFSAFASLYVFLARVAPRYLHPSASLASRARLAFPRFNCTSSSYTAKEEGRRFVICGRHFHPPTNSFSTKHLPNVSAEVSVRWSVRWSIHAHLTAHTGRILFQSCCNIIISDSSTASPSLPACSRRSLLRSQVTVIDPTVV
jgi:hypothetical protein